MKSALGWAKDGLLRQRGHLFPWVPVVLGIGIALYFSLRFEPAFWVHTLGLAFAGAVLLWRIRLPIFAGYAAALVGILALGFSIAGVRAHSVAGPVLDFRYYGAIEGRIVAIDRSASDAVRLTLDRVVLERMAPAQTPARVRVSLHGRQGFSALKPGTTIITTGHLSGPSGAVEPGGFDFRRHAWFLRLGAVGYTRNPVLDLAPPKNDLLVFKARMWLSDRVQSRLPNASGAFAAAVMSGDRSGMSQDVLQDLRDTNLAHLLAISGLHMGLLVAFVFSALRLGLLLCPLTRHTWPIKQVSAVGAFVAALGYLALSGGNVATERAFVMVAVALLAILVNRRALSLRAVALAAIIILLWQPEALLGPGFQMSFAATVSLVAVFERVTVWQQNQKLPRWAKPVLALVLSSAVAGFATAPIAMMHFNRFAQFGLIANLLSVPIMGLLVVPLAVVSALMMPFGLDALPLAALGQGLRWILFVADSVSNWGGSVRHVMAPGAAVLPCIVMGGLILCLWRGSGRLVGLVPALAGAVIWAGAERPPILISDNGALVGVMTEQGRALNREKGQGFVASVWLENDGSGADQFEASQSWNGGAKGAPKSLIYAGLEVVSVQGKTGLKRFDSCEPGQIVVANVALPQGLNCMAFDPETLRKTGSVALWPTAEGLNTKTAAELQGRRLWSQ